MSVLLEGACLIIPNTVLEAKYRGGVSAFHRAWSNASFCSDGKLSRLSYFDRCEAEAVRSALGDEGFDIANDDTAEVALLGHGGEGIAPYLWLDIERTRTGLLLCSLSGVPAGKVAVPGYYQLGTTLAAYGALSEGRLKQRLERAPSEMRIGVFTDLKTGKAVYGPRPLVRH